MVMTETITVILITSVSGPNMASMDIRRSGTSLERTGHFPSYQNVIH